MFGKKTETPSSPSSLRTGNSLSHNSLVQGSRLEGSVISDNDFRIDGMFVGNLKCQARVIIGPSGEFRGEIDCQNAIVEGKFQGNITTREILEVREGAIIEGDVHTQKLVVQSGSVFDVKCTMGDRQENSEVTSTEEETILSEIENGQLD
ncbi:MAG: polymer-forming cytoskeletal protein [Saprospiraceae bacterium]|nr:polymer-forming cytoskeletal protein [Saprospiraceae bacterium]